MIILEANLADAVQEALEGLSSGLYAARLRGLIVELPEFVDFEIDLVSGLNAVSRTSTNTTNHGRTESVTDNSTSIDDPATDKTRSIDDPATDTATESSANTTSTISSGGDGSTTTNTITEY